MWMKKKLNLKGILLLRKKKETQISEYNNEESICLNCNTKLVGGFCHNCGQKHINIKKPLLQVMAPLFDSLFSLDNKLLRTLPPLFIKPGRLSKEYINGKRVRYTAPLKLFMFSSLLYFFLLGMSEGKTSVDYSIETEKAKEELAKADSLLNTLEPEHIAHKETIDNHFDEKIQQIISNPEKYKSRVFKALSYMFFVLMPLFALLLMLLTRKKKRVYIEHLVHSVHIHTFGFCIFSIVLIIELIIGRSSSIVYQGAVTIGLVYLMLSIKRFYHTGWLYSVWKSTLLLSAYSVISIIVMVSSLAVAILL
jgi:ribosomal protein L40E